jgi:hypothetical protein
MNCDFSSVFPLPAGGKRSIIKMYMLFSHAKIAGERTSHPATPRPEGEEMLTCTTTNT